MAAAAAGDDVAAAAALRSTLLESGAADELLRALVALGEADAETRADPMAFLFANVGQATLPPVEKRNPGTKDNTSYGVLEENRALKARVKELRAAIREKKKALKALVPEGTLTVFSINAQGVPDASADASDPFVRISLIEVPNLDYDGDGEDDENEDGFDARAMDPIAFREFCEKHGIAAQTSSKQNDPNPNWEGETLSIVLPSGTPRPPKVLVRVWDDDMSKSDDPLASSEVQLEPLGGKCEGLILKGRGGLSDVTINFEYKMIEPEVDEETKRMTAGL